MSELAGFPYFELQVDKAGSVVDPAQPKALLEHLAVGDATDLLVMSHGWNNNIDQARELYQGFFGALQHLLTDGLVPVGSRRFAVLAVLWPSRKFTDARLIPGGAASLATTGSVSLLERKLTELKGVFDHPDADALLEQASALSPRIASSATARAEFADLVRQLPSSRVGHKDDASDRFFRLSGAEAMERLAKPVSPVRLRRSVGGAAGIGSFIDSVGQAAQNLLNYTTYYQMKERSGLVGRAAVGDLLRRIQDRARGVRLHLIGHSFGARLVTAAVLGREDQPATSFSSLTLLQAAFSHHGFASQFDGKSDGFFRRVVSERRISGPTLITFTANDEAVGLAYPLASLIAGQNASALGDAHDPFGGLGRNGAQRTPEASFLKLPAVGDSSPYAGGAIHNLNADRAIAGHSDICKPQVAYALLSSLART